MSRDQSRDIAHDHPEWAGYLAAFDAYLDARKNGDKDLEEQARTLMSYFAAANLEVTAPRPRGGAGRKPVADLGPALDQLGLR